MSRIYDKDRRKRVKVNILYTSAMDSNIFLFEIAKLRIGHGQVSQDQAVSTCVQGLDQ